MALNATLVLDAAIQEAITQLIKVEGPEYIAEFWGDLKTKFGSVIDDVRAFVSKSNSQLPVHNSENHLILNSSLSDTSRAASDTAVAPSDDDMASTTGLKEVKDAPKQVHHGIVALFSLKGVYFGEGLNDRSHLLEFVIALMINSKLTEGIRKKLHDAAINTFYTDLPHPPTYAVEPDRGIYDQSLRDEHGNFKKDRRRYAHRNADGSNNNLFLPMLGMANQPYARTVPSVLPSNPSALPDPGLVFDTLLRRAEGSFVPHPSGLSSLFFAFADLVIHSLFKTNHADPFINSSSSYLDLSPLYGNSDAEVDRVRVKDGTGRLHNDVFSDYRLLMMPPAVSALLVLLSRNHNYIATKLLSINERRVYFDPSTLSDKDKLKQDDQLFQQARLVNTGYFMQIILRDYVGGILGFTRDRTTWRLDPLSPLGKGDSVSVPRGEGNAVSLEFNLMYRWHSIVSEKDAEWTGNLFSQLFPQKTPDEVTPEEFGQAVRVYVMNNLDVTNPKSWTFDGLKRDEQTGRFDDAALAEILQDSTNSIAGAFRARGNPTYLRVIEILGIEEARAWGTCSMNEFRKFMGLKPFKSFAEWNRDPEIHLAAEKLYKNIDNLELYVGLQAEETNVPGLGSSLCPGYTVARAILSDAICLTRGDRFLTIEFTPHNLSTWGYNDCILSEVNKVDGSYGGLVTKLLFRTLPDYYPAGSAYAHFPFYVPEFLRDEWLEMGHHELVRKYSWERPLPPRFPNITLEEDLKAWRVAAFEAKLHKLTGGVELNIADKVLADAKERNWAQKFAELTKKLIANKSVAPSRVDRDNDFLNLDVVRDVINLLPVHWLCESIGGLSLKSEDNKKGTLLEQDVYQDLATVAQYLLLNFEPTHDWSLRERSVTFYKEFEASVLSFFEHGIVRSIIDWFAGLKDEEVKQFLKDMKKGNRKEDAKALAASIFAQLVPSAAQFSHVLSLAVDFFADDEAAREEMVRLAALNTEEANDTAIMMILEALAFEPPVSSVLRTATADAIVDGKQVHAGQRVFVNLKTTVEAAVSSSDSSLFPGLSSDGLLSSPVFALIAPKVLAEIFKLKGLKKTHGFDKFTQIWRDGKTMRYVDARGNISPFPVSLLVQYDA